MQATTASVQVTAKNDIMMEAQTGKVQIKAQQGVKVETPQKVEVAGDSGVDVKTSMGPIEIKSGSTANLEASAITTVKGSMVKIN